MNHIKQANSYCTLYLVRHGETEWNALKKIQGHADIPLNAKGQQQARQAAKRFKNIKFAAIYSSDLLRAKHTAEIIALEHAMAVVASKMLRERSFGKYEGSTREEMKELFDEFDQMSEEERRHYTFGGVVESDEVIVSRVLTFLCEVSLLHKGNTVLVGSHSGLMRAILIHLGYATYKQLKRIFITNAAHIRLHCDGVEFFVDEVLGLEKGNKKVFSEGS